MAQQQPQVLPDKDIIISWAQNHLEGVNKNNVLTADQLSIVWGKDPRYWKKVAVTDPESHYAVNVAYKLNEVCWLQIDGKYDPGNLTSGKIYAVYFIVQLTTNLSMNGYVTLKLVRSNGRLLVKKEDLGKHPKNTWVGIKVGEFIFNRRYNYGRNIKFSINGCDGTTWKTGLIVIGAAIMQLTA